MTSLPSLPIVPVQVAPRGQAVVDSSRSNTFREAQRALAAALGAAQSGVALTSANQAAQERQQALDARQSIAQSAGEVARQRQTQIETSIESVQSTLTHQQQMFDFEKMSIKELQTAQEVIASSPPEDQAAAYAALPHTDPRLHKALSRSTLDVKASFDKVRLQQELDEALSAIGKLPDALSLDETGASLGLVSELVGKFVSDPKLEGLHKGAVHDYQESLIGHGRAIVERWKRQQAMQTQGEIDRRVPSQVQETFTQLMEGVIPVERAIDKVETYFGLASYSGLPQAQTREMIVDLAIESAKSLASNGFSILEIKDNFFKAGNKKWLRDNPRLRREFENIEAIQRQDISSDLDRQLGSAYEEALVKIATGQPNATDDFRLIAAEQANLGQKARTPAARADANAKARRAEELAKSLANTAARRESLVSAFGGLSATFVEEDGAVRLTEPGESGTGPNVLTSSQLLNSAPPEEVESALAEHMRNTSGNMAPTPLQMYTEFVGSGGLSSGKFAKAIEPDVVAQLESQLLPLFADPGRFAQSPETLVPVLQQADGLIRSFHSLQARAPAFANRLLDENPQLDTITTVMDLSKDGLSADLLAQELLLGSTREGRSTAIGKVSKEFSTYRNDVRESLVYMNRDGDSVDRFPFFGGGANNAEVIPRSLNTRIDSLVHLHMARTGEAAIAVKDAGKQLSKMYSTVWVDGVSYAANSRDGTAQYMASREFESAYRMQMMQLAEASEEGGLVINQDPNIPLWFSEAAIVNRGFIPALVGAPLAGRVASLLTGDDVLASHDSSLFGEYTLDLDDVTYYGDGPDKKMRIGLFYRDGIQWSEVEDPATRERVYIEVASPDSTEARRAQKQETDAFNRKLSSQAKRKTLRAVTEALVP